MLVDYYEMFYEESHYLRDHIPHGLLISGYDDERKVFLLQESAHMRFVAMYPLPLTYEMVYRLWAKSKAFIESNGYFGWTLFCIHASVAELNQVNTRGFLKKYVELIRPNENNTIWQLEYLSESNLKTSQVQSAFRRRFGSSHKIFFDFLRRILNRECLCFGDEFAELEKEYLTFYDVLCNKVLRDYLKTGLVHIERLDEIKAKSEKLDTKLADVLRNILEDGETLLIMH